MNNAFTQIVYISSIIVASICILMAVIKSYRTESYWPDAVWSGGHYWQSQQTFNNNNRYFDMAPYLGIYRHVDLGTYKTEKKKTAS
jgi:hypothetical protein